MFGPKAHAQRHQVDIIIPALYVQREESCWRDHLTVHSLSSLHLDLGIELIDLFSEVIL